MKIVWDLDKNSANVRNHGVSFEAAQEIFTSSHDYLELYDDAHSDVEDRFIAIGPLTWSRPGGLDRTRRRSGAHHQRPLGDGGGAEPLQRIDGRTDMTDTPELTAEQFARALPASVRRRLIEGRIESGADIAALRRFIGLTQAQLAAAMGISVATLRNWEQGRRRPDGPAVALLRIAARHPRIILENVRVAA